MNQARAEMIQIDTAPNFKRAAQVTLATLIFRWVVLVAAMLLNFAAGWQVARGAAFVFHATGHLVAHLLHVG